MVESLRGGSLRTGRPSFFPPCEDKSWLVAEGEGRADRPLIQGRPALDGGKAKPTDAA